VTLGIAIRDVNVYQQNVLLSNGYNRILDKIISENSKIMSEMSK